jgi:hypothetical protein
LKIYWLVSLTVVTTKTTELRHTAMQWHLSAFESRTITASPTYASFLAFAAASSKSITNTFTFVTMCRTNLWFESMLLHCEKNQKISPRILQNRPALSKLVSVFRFQWPVISKLIFNQKPSPVIVRQFFCQK